MQFTLKKSKRKSVSLEILKDGSLLVHSPLFFTEKDAERFIEKNKPWIDKHLPGIIHKNSVFSSLSREDEKLARGYAKKLFSAITNEYATVMGVFPKRITVTSAEKRFGSCSGDNAICYSWRLMYYPIDAIRYVCVHELSHIKEHNHSARFHSTVNQYISEDFEKLLKPENVNKSNFEENIKILNRIMFDENLQE